MHFEIAEVPGTVTATRTVDGAREGGFRVAVRVVVTTAATLARRRRTATRTTGMSDGVPATPLPTAGVQTGVCSKEPGESRG